MKHIARNEIGGNELGCILGEEPQRIVNVTEM